MPQNGPDPRRRKRLSSRAVLGGVVLMVVSVLLDSRGAPMSATTVGGLVGFVLVLYGVHVGWLIFYDREPDGPSS